MFTRLLQRLEETVIGLLLVTTTVLVFIEVVMRFVFSYGVLWMEQLGLHLAAWLVLFGASYGLKTGAHIGVDAVTRLLADPLKRLVALIAIGLSLVYCGLLMYGAWLYLDKLYKIGLEMQDLAFPKWIAQSILFFGFAMLALRLLQLLWQVVRREANGFFIHTEADEALSEAGVIPPSRGI